MADQRQGRRKTKKCNPSYLKEVYYILSSWRVGVLQVSEPVPL